MKRKLVVFLVFNFYNFFVFSQIKDLQTDSLSYIWGDYYFLNSMFEESILKYKKTEYNLSIDRLRNLADSYIITNNLLDAKGLISVSERQSYILKVRTLAKKCCESWLEDNG